MTAQDARALLVDAVRRDLFGPTGPDDTVWPGAEPKIVTADTAFDAWRDVKGVFIDGDGHEVLTGSPLRRYGIGILFPKGLSRRQEEALDAAQADAAHDAAGTEADAATGGLEPPPAPTEHVGAVHADTEDAEETDTPFRPWSMAVSFLVDSDSAAELAIDVTGGRYERMASTVAGAPATFWRRQPVSVRVTTAAHGDDEHRDVTVGPLQLRVGAVHRPHSTGTIVTVYLLNVSVAGGDLHAATGAALFQAQLTVQVPLGAVTDYPNRRVLEGDDRSLELLYHRAPVRAVGHGCNATHEIAAGGEIIVGDHFPVEVVRSPVPDAVDEAGKRLAVDMDDLGDWAPDSLDAVVDIFQAYEAWITHRQLEVSGLPADLRATAERHLAACERFLDDAREGWRLATADTDVQQILRWTSTAMADQRRAYAAHTRPLVFNGKIVVGAEGPSPHGGAARGVAQWRAFQLAFLLASLPAMVNPNDARFDTVDIIWMPTGGGKTEAYSAVAAFTMLWRRYQQVRSSMPIVGQGATVMMRYTLRLLTAQQLQRAAALICALEQIRRGNPALLGEKRKFTIGSWLGRTSTPNDWSGARNAIREWRSDSTKRGFLLTRCPWCAAAMGRRPGVGQKEIDGYKVVPAPSTNESRVMAYCPDPTCPFTHDANQAAAKQGLPVYEVDSDLYLQAPTFIVGTIDKFAMLAWRTEPSRFFGLVNGERTGPGPALLIQDELHLISGPLGSLDALYEPVLEDLCLREGGCRPRIVAATATTRRYAEQSAALYGRSKTRLIPPPGLDAGDNFFSRSSPEAPGKLFVGICAPGFGKAQEAQIRTVAVLGHAVGSLDAAGHNADPWWTNLMFFSSRRSLGLVQSLVQTHLRSHSWRLHRATGVDAGPPRQTTGTRLTVRSLLGRVELTAQATSDVSEAMDRLSIPQQSKGAADLCFATSMIEVGVDIDRLGLLTMFGQPKSASQYIQVAGRVGRDERDAPGVVFVILSAYNSRDRSHFEQFSTFHRRLYASVEPVSITPYTPAALERGLAGAMTAWMRQAGNPANPVAAQPLLPAACRTLAERVDAGSREHQRLEARYRELAEDLKATTHDVWGTLRPGGAGSGFLRSQSDAVTAGADSPEAVNTQWLVPTSMRSVDAEAGARAIRHTKSAAAGSAGVPSAVETREEDVI